KNDDVKKAGNVFYVEKRILKDGEYLGHVRIGILDNSHAQNFSFVLTYILPLLFGVALIGGGCLRLFIGRTVLSPVIRLSEQAKLAEQGEMVIFEGGDRDDEVGSLSGSLEHLNAKLVQIQSELDQKVSERTEAVSKVNHKLRDEV
ncbi:response regulator, partial [Aduncisulcus paluster]